MLPIKDLNNYLQSSRKDGQDFDNIPVIEMGSIEVPNNNWIRKVAYATSFCLFIGLGILAYNKNFTIVVESDSKNIAELVSDSGCSVYYVKKEDDTYKIKFFTLRNINSLIKRLSENKDIRRVELSN